MQPAPSPSSKNYRTVLTWLVVAVLFITLAWHQHCLVDQYATNVMYWDQWSIYGPMIEERGWWAGFDYQHGPHRQGAGFIVTRMLAEASGWDSRWDAFGVSWTLILAAAAGLVLAWKCGAKMLPLLALVPVLYLSARQYEQFAGPANISHGAMPMLLLTLYALAWFVRGRGVRLLLLVPLTFLAIFTGFAFYAGVISLVLLGLETWQLTRERDVQGALQAAAALVAVAASWGLFFLNYRNASQATGPIALWEMAGQVARFIGVMMANSQGLWGAGWFATTAGLLLYALLAGLGVFHGWHLVRHGVAKSEPRRIVIFVFAAFVVMYCASAAIGRLGEGIEAARASRYVTLMIPAGLSFCLQLSVMRHRWFERGVVPAYLVLLLVLTTQLRHGDLKQAERFREGRELWAKTYLETRDVPRANAAAGQEIYPGSTIYAQLRYLEAHGLNFFKDTPPVNER